MARSLNEIRNDLAAKTKEIAPLAQRFVDGGDKQLNDDELKQFRDVHKEIETLTAEQSDAQRTEQERKDDEKAAREAIDLGRQYNSPAGRSLSGRVPRESDGVPQQQQDGDSYRSIGERFVDSDEFKQYRENGLGRGVRSAPFGLGSLYEPAERRAVITSGTLAPTIQPQRLPGIMAPDQPELRMRDVFPSGRTGTNQVEFVLEGSRVNNAAETAEATDFLGTTAATGLKPESGFDLSLETAPVRTIATLLYIPRTAMDDADQMQSYIDQLLRRFVAEREDRQLLLGDGVNPNLTGINVVSGRQNLNGAYWFSTGKDGLNMVDRIRHAKTRIRLGGRGRASAIVLNPERLEEIETLKKSGTSNEYLLPNGGPFGSALVPRLWGLPVIEHEDQPVNFATVADGRAAMVFDRMDARIYVTDSNRDLFERNILTILCESRLAFPIFFPSRIAYTDLVATA